MPVDVDRFRAAVEQLTALREQGHLRVEVTPRGAVNLVFDEEGAPYAPEGGGGLYIDIEDVLAATAAGVPIEDFARVRQTRTDALAEEEATAREKYEMVASRLSAGLQRRAWLRTTSKVYVLASFEWEVVSKLADSSSVPRPADASETLYGLLRLDTERAGGDGPPDQKVTVVGLDAEDLDDLIGGLTSLRAALGAETANVKKEEHVTNE
jgi:hypothetical protein